MEKQIFLHTGMPKCGSTYLQEEIFPYVEDLHFTHLQLYNNCPIAKFIQKVRYANPITYNYETNKKAVWDYIHSLKESKVLISWEGLYGDPFGNHGNATFLLDVLKDFFPNAKILYIIRQQASLLDSLYKQAIHQYHSVRIDQFLNYNSKKKTFGEYEPAWWQGINVDVRSFDMHAFAQKYHEFFGRNNVFITPFEYMIENKDGFLKEIYDFLEVNGFYPNTNKPQNRSYSKYTIGTALFLNKFVKRDFNTIRIIPMHSFFDPMFLLKKIDSIKYKKVKFIDSEKESAIMEFYSKSNRQLDNYVNQNLANYNYF